MQFLIYHALTFYNQWQIFIIYILISSKYFLKFIFIRNTNINDISFLN